MNKLFWVIDSPYSRAVKWLLSSLNVQHQDHLMSWENMTNDPELANHNPKLQVPTLLWGDQSINDSLLIALRFLPVNWHQTCDAKLFRLADSDFEAAIIFFFRANLLEKNFGNSEQSEFMRQAGIATYTKSIDVLFDNLLAENAERTLNFGLVLAFSTLLACRHLANSQKIDNYRVDELLSLSDWIECNECYRQIANDYAYFPESELPFFVKYTAQGGPESMPGSA